MSNIKQVKKVVEKAMKNVVSVNSSDSMFETLEEVQAAMGFQADDLEKVENPGKFIMDHAKVKDMVPYVNIRFNEEHKPYVAAVILVPFDNFSNAGMDKDAFTAVDELLKMDTEMTKRACKDAITETSDEVLNFIKAFVDRNIID